MLNDDFNNGFIKRVGEGRYEGNISIEGINLSPIVGTLFKKEDKTYLWLRRKDMLVYDDKEQRYKKRKREPRWEAYLGKTVGDNTVSFRGEFPFMRWRFSIVGVWDKVEGRDTQRLNFYVERLPLERQDLLRLNTQKSIR